MKIPHNVYVVLKRLTSIDLEHSLIYHVFTEHGACFEMLGIDLFNIFKNPITGRLYLDCLAMDLKEMIEINGLDVSYTDTLDELIDLVREIDIFLSRVNIHESRLRNIQFLGLDTLILEYNQL